MNLNNYTREKIGAFIQILKSLGVEKEQIRGVCGMLETEDMMHEILDRLEAEGFKTTPQETMNICGEVIIKHFGQKSPLAIPQYKM